MSEQSRTREFSAGVDRSYGGKMVYGWPIASAGSAWIEQSKGVALQVTAGFTRMAHFALPHIVKLATSDAIGS